MLSVALKNDKFANAYPGQAGMNSHTKTQSETFG
jgi:hypothetical protein